MALAAFPVLKICSAQLQALAAAQVLMALVTPTTSGQWLPFTYQGRCRCSPAMEKLTYIIQVFHACHGPKKMSPTCKKNKANCHCRRTFKAARRELKAKLSGSRSKAGSRRKSCHAICQLAPLIAELQLVRSGITKLIRMESKMEKAVIQ